MTELPERYHRNTLLFGAEGQLRLRGTSVAIVGAGGLGSALGALIALLGPRKITTIDSEELDETNRNRFVGARHADPVPGSSKVKLMDRMIREIDPSIDSDPISHDLVSEEAFRAVRASDWVFGCFDEDGPRAVLNELCAAYAKPYIDLASDVPEPGIYGGRVCVSVNGAGCLDCLGQLDRKAVRRYFETSEQVRFEDAIYGIDRGALQQKGPSVAPLNGVVASIAAMEFMVAVTGLRAPIRLQEYRGWEGKVVVSTDMPRNDCPRCKGMWGQGVKADVERYLSISHLRRRR